MLHVISYVLSTTFESDIPSLSSSFVMRPASESLDEMLELDIREQSTVSSPCILSRFFGFAFLVGLDTLISQSIERSLQDLLRFPHLEYKN